MHIKSDAASRNTNVIEGRPEKRRCGENCRASHSLFSKMFKRSAYDAESAQKRKILKDLAG